MSEEIDAEDIAELLRLIAETGVPIPNIIMGVCRFMGEITSIQEKKTPATNIEKVLQLIKNSVIMEYEIAKEKLKDVPVTPQQDLTKH